MTLAQLISEPAGVVAGGFFGFGCLKVIELIKTFLNDRRERENDKRRDLYLAEIAKTNLAAANSLKEVSVNQILGQMKLEQAIKTSGERHAEVVTAIKSTCKATQAIKAIHK